VEETSTSTSVAGPPEMTYRRGKMEGGKNALLAKPKPTSEARSQAYAGIEENGITVSSTDDHPRPGTQTRNRRLLVVQPLRTGTGREHLLKHCKEWKDQQKVRGRWPGEEQKGER
jgi:hypothetical protein